MKPKHRKNLKKLGSLLVKGGKKSSKFVKKYGPIVQHHARSISESTMDAMRPDPQIGYVDIRKRGELKKMTRRAEMGNKLRGGYIDMTKRKPMHRKVRNIKGRAFIDLT